MFSMSPKEGGDQTLQGYRHLYVRPFSYLPSIMEMPSTGFVNILAKDCFSNWRKTSGPSWSHRLL